jgi:uncharacterized protein
MKSFFLAGLAVLALAGAGPAAAQAQDPTLHQVYEALQAGRVAEAQTMMGEVLRDHPNSAKAHYVDAEVLARAGHYGDAEGELARAQKLEPGLPFAKPDSVRELRALIASGGARHVSSGLGLGAAGAAAPAAAGFPWGGVLLLLGAVVLAWLFFSRRSAQRTAMAPGGTMPAAAGMPGGGYAMPQAYPPAGGGLGSGILGGLATGAAVGAGMVAGEALASEFIGGHGHPHEAQRLVDEGAASMPADDLGGQDFGVSDSASWDDGGSSGQDDWN